MMMDIQQSCFGGVMLAVGRLVGIEKTIKDKVSSKWLVVVSLWSGLVKLTSPTS